MKIFGYEITRSKMEKFVELSGGGNAYGTPPSWMTSYLGPGQPISPITPSSDVEVPRTIDYPISVNSQLTPRSGYGLMPFSQLMLAYEKVPECRFPVNLIHRQLSSYIPKLVDKNGNVIKDHPYSWMTNSPDGRNPWSVWMTRYLKSAKIYDAPALYIQRDHNGSIAGLDFIDGSTLFVIVDERGNTPMPERVQDYVTRRVQDASYPTPPPMSALIPNSARGPATVDGFIQQYNRRLLANQSVPLKIPAYTQVIKGTPYSWWSSDDIWYMPESRRVNAPYGEPFIEAAWPWVMIVVNLTAFELAHYRTGNMPEGYVTLPRDWLATPDQLEALEIAFNQRMTRNPVTERNRIRLFPDGSKWFQTKRGDWPESLYDRARGNILDEIGIPPAEAGDIPGKGLGGKGFKEGGTVELNRNTINPNRITVLAPFNWTLQHDGVDDVTLTLEAPLGEIDPQKLKETVYDGMTHGTYSLNDGRSLLNLQPIGDVNDPKNIANKHMIVAGAAIYVIEDMEVSQGMAVPTFTGQQSGGQPAGPETAMQKYGAEHTAQDYATLEQAMLHASENGTLSGKFYSLPLAKEFNEDEHPRDSKGRFGEGGGGKKEPKPGERGYRMAHRPEDDLPWAADEPKLPFSSRSEVIDKLNAGTHAIEQIDVIHGGFGRGRNGGEFKEKTTYQLVHWVKKPDGKVVKEPVSRIKQNVAKDVISQLKIHRRMGEGNHLHMVGRDNPRLEKVIYEGEGEDEELEFEKMPAADHPRDSHGRWIAVEHDDEATQGENEAPKVFHTPGGAHRQRAQAQPLAEHLPEPVEIDERPGIGGVGVGALGEPTKPVRQDFGTEVLNREGKDNNAVRDAIEAYHQSEIKRQNQNWNDDDKQVAFEYTYKEPNRIINGQARGTSDTEVGRQGVAAMDSLLSKSVLEDHTTVYRGVDAEGMKDLGKLSTGDTFTDRGFVSTSLYARHAAGFMYGDEDTGALFKIELSAGSHAAHIDESAPEVVLPRNTSFKVTKIEKVPYKAGGTGPGIKLYHLQVVSK